MNIYLFGKNSAMLFFEKKDLEAHPNDDLHSLAASVLPEEFAEKETDMVSFSVNGGLVLRLDRRKRAMTALRFERPGRFYDALIDLKNLLTGELCEIYRAGDFYYALLEDCSLARSLRSALGSPSVSHEFVLEHGARVSSFVLKRETVGKGAHRRLQRIDRHSL